MKLSPNFSLEEFAVSRGHPELVEPVPEAYEINVLVLVSAVLQPLRSWWGKPMRVISGYRSARLNRAVGGSKTSQHRTGSAADIETENIRMLFLQMLEGHAPVVAAGQVIYYPERNFIHFALPSSRFPSITFCVHSPTHGAKYQPITRLEEFQELMSS